MNESAHKRKKYLIKRGLQLKYATLLIITLTAVSLFACVVLYLGIWEFVAKEFSELIVSQKISTAQRILSYESARYGKSYPSGDSIMEEAKRLSEHEKEAIKEILKKVNLRLIPRILFIVLVIGVASIFLTHKIAGPLYRFEKNVKAISDGDLSVRFNIRRGDDLKELADKLTIMTERFGELIVRFKDLSENLFAQTQSLSHTIKQLPLEERETISTTLERIAMLSKELKDLSNTLKVKKEKS
ncbi:MAG: methyl-accepting chemotaxis protein [Candidatus Omnitrophica bacterium]|nr:methyl-accepting chemotaxis protein [Candidatus Omnitrophota bacterium]